jgi:hypothetical protein
MINDKAVQDKDTLFENSEAPKDFINPIDPKKVAVNPGLLPYAHSANGAVIRPEDLGRVKGNSMTAMYEQTDRQMDQLREQMETLVIQAKELQKRKHISEMIYQATLNFRPVMGHTYHLYKKKDETHTISLIGPNEWGRKKPYTYIATCKLLYDHTWEILEDSLLEVYLTEV